MQFYQINYATYPRMRPIETFSPSSIAAADLDAASKLLNATGSDVSESVAPSGAKLLTTIVTRNYLPAKRFGCSMRSKAHESWAAVGPAAAFAGKDRGFVLRIYWTATSSRRLTVRSGLLRLFVGDPAARSLMVGSDDGTCYCYSLCRSTIQQVTIAITIATMGRRMKKLAMVTLLALFVRPWVHHFAVSRFLCAGGNDSSPVSSRMRLPKAGQLSARPRQYGAARGCRYRTTVT